MADLDYSTMTAAELEGHINAKSDTIGAIRAEQLAIHQHLERRLASDASKRTPGSVQIIKPNSSQSIMEFLANAPADFLEALKNHFKGGQQ